MLFQVLDTYSLITLLSLNFANFRIFFFGKAFFFILMCLRGLACFVKWTIRKFMGKCSSNIY